LSSSQSHAAITNYCRNGETAIRQWPRARERMKSITDIEKSGQSSWRRFYLIAGGQAGSVAATGGYSTGVSQTDSGWPLTRDACLPPPHEWPTKQPRLLGWSFMGRRQARIASRDGCPRRGGGDGVERDPLVGLMLAGQQSRLRPGATMRRRRGNWFLTGLNVLGPVLAQGLVSRLTINNPI